MDACDLEAMGLDGLAGFPDSLSLDCLELDCLGVGGLELDGLTGGLELDGLTGGLELDGLTGLELDCLELDGLAGCLGELDPEALGPIAERG